MITNIILSILTIFLCFQPIIAQEQVQNTKSYDEIIWDDIKYFIDDFAYTGNQLVNMRTRGYVTGIGVIGVTALLMNSDHNVRSFSELNRSVESDSYFLTMDNGGLVQTSLILSGGIYAAGLFSGSEDIRVTGRLLGESLFLAGVCTSVLKYTFGRARPSTVDDNALYEPFRADDAYNSLPSGHTTVAFAMASVLAQRIDTWWGYVGCYGLAASTGYARIYRDRHWVSDVFLGAAIGTLSGLVITSAEKSRQNAKAGKIDKLVFYPSYNGFGFTYNF